MNILIIVTILALLQTGRGSDVQKQLEWEYAFDYIVEMVSEGRVSSFEGGNLRRCVQSKCCICGKQFKNTTYSSIHIALHHHESLKHPQEIALLFDDNVPAQQKYQFCLQYLKEYSLSAVQKEDVCLIVSEEYYKPRILIDVVKYILYVALAILLMIYYSDVTKGS